MEMTGVDGRYSEYSGVYPLIQQNTKESLQASKLKKKKKQRDIVPLTFPKLKPAEAAGMYLLSKFYQREPKRYPQSDVARESIGLDLVNAKRQVHLANKRLNDKRRACLKKFASFEQQYKELEEKEAVFQISFRKFNKFVRENQEKRERAEKKILEEKALQEKRSAEIESVEENIVHLTEIKAQMDVRTKEYRMFEDYLTGVVRLSPMFKNISDILIRYDALTEAKKFLSERQNAQLAALENARSEVAKLLEEKGLVLIGLNNQLLELQGRYETANSHSLLWETLVSKIQDVCVRTTQELQSVKTVCWNMYNNMCARKGVTPKKSKHDSEGQLMFIKGTMRELYKIDETARHVWSHETNSVRGEIGSDDEI